MISDKQLFDLLHNDDSDTSFVKQLTSFKTSWEEPSWNLNKVEMFKRAVENEFARNFPYKYKLIWERDFGINGEHVLNITINTSDWGQISTQLNVEMIKTNKYNKDFPLQLQSLFKKKFDEKIASIKEKLSKLQEEKKTSNVTAILESIPKPPKIKVPKITRQQKP